MNKLNNNDLHQLELLRHVEQTPQLNNRLAAEKLGVSVKLAHELLKGMVSRGLFHVKKLHARRWDYFLTPHGLTEKARLTREFMSFSMQFYREARKASSRICRDIAEAGLKKVAFIGTGELAEIAYIGVKEWSLELTEIYDDRSDVFLGLKTDKIDHLDASAADAIIICLYDKAQPMSKNYLPPDISKRKNMYWVF